MITQKMAASKDIAATWGGGRAEGAGRPSGPVRNGPDRSGPPLPCRGLDPCSSPVFCRQVESLQAACRHQARCRTHVTPSLDVHHHGRTQQELAAMSHKPESAAGRCFRGPSRAHAPVQDSKRHTRSARALLWSMALNLLLATQTQLPSGGGRREVVPSG